MRCNGVICRIEAQVDGTKYDVGSIKATEADKLAGWTGYTVREWEANLAWDSDPLAARGLLALMRFRQGENIRFSDVEIEDIDSIDARLVDPQGRTVTISFDEDGKPLLIKGQAQFLFDGEPLDPPSPPRRKAAQTG